jgi:hypothetical protein
VRRESKGHIVQNTSTSRRELQCTVLFILGKRKDQPAYCRPRETNLCTYVRTLRPALLELRVLRFSILERQSLRRLSERTTFGRVLYFAPLPANAEVLASLSFLAWSHALPVPPALASLWAFFSSFSVLALSRGSMTTISSSAFFL